MIKVSKTVKGGDKMNTKDYIETKKSKKLSDIFKGVLVAGLVVGSMVTSTACKPNQPHESSSSTSTIETTTSEITKIDEPVIRTDEQVEKFIDTIKLRFNQIVKVDNVDAQYVGFATMPNKETGELLYKMALVQKMDNDEKLFIAVGDIDKDKFIKIYNELSKNGYWSEDELSEKYFTIKFLKEICSGEVLDAMTEWLLEEYVPNQSSQDDLVR